MPCFRPRTMYPTAEGGRWSCDPAMAAEGATGTVVNCGDCRGCMLRRSGEWSQRCTWELANPVHEGVACFLTLSHRDEDLPEDYSVHREEITRFMMELRRQIVRRMKAGELVEKRDAKGRLSAGVRFYAVGEYGEKEEFTKRPHYHLIIFGWAPDDLEPAEKSKSGFTQWKSAFLGGVEDAAGLADRSGVWKKGRVRIGEVTRQSIGYVTGYIFDKKWGAAALLEYSGRLHPVSGELCDVDAPFNHMSRMPGIGEWWFREFEATDATADFVVRDERVVAKQLGLDPDPVEAFHPRLASHNTKKVGMPRYVVRKLLDALGGDAEAVEQFKAERRAKAEARAAAHAQDNTPSRLMTREAAHLLGVASLVRSGDDPAALKARVEALYTEAGRLAEAERDGSAQVARDSDVRVLDERRQAHGPAVAVSDGIARLEAARGIAPLVPLSDEQVKAALAAGAAKWKARVKERKAEKAAKRARRAEARDARRRAGLAHV